MKESYLFDMSFNNLVFSDRNKAYGAYALRKNYAKNITTAAIMGTLIFAGVVVTPIIRSMLVGVKVEKPEVLKKNERVLEDIPLLPPPKPVKPKAEALPPAQPAKEKVATQKYVEPKVVHNNVDTPEDVPDQSTFKTAEISNVTQKGIAPETPTVAVETNEPAGTGTEELNEPYVYVEQMPMFGNSESDLINYMSKNIRYPSRARNAGIEGLVVVTFVVTATGEVQDIEVVKGLGYGTEEEAKRVVGKMPKWTPGKQNGRAVPVRYTLPIRLQLEN